MRRARGLFTLTLVGFLSLAHRSWAQDRCDAILSSGIFDVTATASDEAAASSFFNWYASATRRSSSSGGSGGISVLGVVSAGGQGVSEEEAQQAILAYQRGDATRHQRLAAVARRASAVIANAWTTCMTSTYGLKVSPRFTSDKNELYLVFQFQPSNPVRYPASKILKITPGSSDLTCDTVGRRGVPISAAQRPFHCRRNDNKSVSVSFETEDAIVNLANGPIFDFPAVTEAPLPPQCTSPTQLRNGLSATAGGDRLFDGSKGTRGINSGTSASDFTINFASPQWVHHLVVYPIADRPGLVRTQFFGITPTGPIPFDEQTRTVVTGANYRVDFDTTRSQATTAIRINTTDPRSWVAFSEVEIFVCQ
jgi:hypothetical protein